jgi:hypothetical protein
MKPKEKAQELWGKYFQLNYDWDGGTKDEWAKEGALIAVDEMIDVYASACVAMGMSKEDAEKQESKYLLEVKQEIEKLYHGKSK